MKIFKLIYVILFTFLCITSKAQSMDSERVMINEINLVRTSPKLYKQFVIDFVKNNPNYKKINETDDCVRELLDKLDTMVPLNKIYFNNSLYLAIGDMSLSPPSRHPKSFHCPNIVTHDFNELGRIQKYDKSISIASENIIQGNMVYSSDIIEKYTMRDCIIRLLIDWGVSDRGHRNNILDPLYNVIAVKGVYVGNTIWYIQEFAYKDPN